MSGGPTLREQLLFKAKIAEQGDCYEDMVDIMKRIVDIDGDLTVEERNLFSIAYKNLISGKRMAWRFVNSLWEKEKNKDAQSWKINQLLQLRQSLEDNLNAVCNEIIKIMDEKIISVSDAVESKIFWYKMKGDYYRYIAEYEHESRKELAQNESFRSYETALAQVNESILCTSPILLGLVLNFSVFYYEIMGDKEKAIQMAKQYFDKAISETDKLDGEDLKDTTLILQLLRDNISSWNEEGDDDDDE